MKDLDYTFGHCDVYCDGKDCKTEEQIEGFDGHPPQYSNVNEELRGMGWKITKEGGEWKEYCPSCVGNNNEQQL